MTWPRCNMQRHHFMETFPNLCLMVYWYCVVVLISRTNHTYTWYIYCKWYKIHHGNVLSVNLFKNYRVQLRSRYNKNMMKNIATLTHQNIYDYHHWSFKQRRTWWRDQTELSLRKWPFVRGTTGNRWIPSTKASGAELWCFLWSTTEQTVEQTIETPVIWDATPFIRT